MSSPEKYWIDRGQDLIGLDVLEQGQAARQASTYNAIAAEIQFHDHFMILDIGCNIGALRYFLLPDKDGMLPMYRGIDSNPNAVRFCTEKGLIVELGSIQKIGEKDKRFDCVVVKDVLEHLESLDPSREAFRVAGIAAILSFFIPPTPGSESIHQTEHGYYHNRYDENNLLEIATSCGFVLEKRIDTWETDGNMNRTYVFLRRQK